MTKPELHDFGVTAEEYNLYARNFNDEEIGFSVALISLAIVVPPTAWPSGPLALLEN